jgi:hypothetical protein
MAVVSIPYNDPWVVARWAFGRLLDRTAETLVSEEDREALERAKALDGLHFGLLEDAQAERIARAMEAAADQLRFELEGADADDPRPRRVRRSAGCS